MCEKQALYEIKNMIKRVKRDIKLDSIDLKDAVKSGDKVDAKLYRKAISISKGYLKSLKNRLKTLADSI